MTIGNHELYVYEDTYDMYESFIPHFEGRYLTSNVNITILNSDGEAVSVPVGSRYAKFTTAMGRGVTSLGVLFDFTGNAHNTTVQPVAKMVKEPWFAEAIAEEPDVIVLVGHMAVSNDSWPVVFNAIRAVHPLTPIMIFGGHTHIRDCQQYDGRSMGMESGRYMETIGANLNAGKDNANDIKFSRRYLDQNRVTYQYHTKTSNLTFDTRYGRSITEGLHDLAEQYGLSYQYGISPRDYTMTRDPYPSDGSLLTLFIEDLSINKRSFRSPLTPSKLTTPAPTYPVSSLRPPGTLRFDIFKGPFTKNDQLTASPYPDQFLYISGVTLRVANQKRTEMDAKSWELGYVDNRFQTWLGETERHTTHGKPGRHDLNFGYVTVDSCPEDGDDTLHTLPPSYDIPDYMMSSPPNVTDDTPIDLVFVDFIETPVLSILNELQSEKKYSKDDISLYNPVMSNQVFGLYAQAYWN
ncbi:Metallo-dependent phosphatase-like protein [Pisolithus orientalis]|uniref:Metallo-dependent phosphatase-like protein n=1 Tax=Pisolithus orientalis TaxID=936130 RepID=UPI00222588AD|nr:Metallo-dependent phosphatase-like protein [Pisolithus orientalis]KAI5995283.1 Metallo-dependent phosphatase-like protein [Pisolithus orientalis]